MKTTLLLAVFGIAAINISHKSRAQVAVFLATHTKGEVKQPVREYASQVMFASNYRQQTDKSQD